MAYDCIIKNGKLVDFSNNTTHAGSVYIRDGKIVTPDNPGDEQAAKIVDAKGHYVLPGLIDEHGHWFHKGNEVGVNADMVCPCSGITTAIDAGTTGIGNFEIFNEAYINRYTTDIRAYLHVSSYGVIALHHTEESHRVDDIKESAIISLYQRYPRVFKGLKVRISDKTTAGLGVKPLKKAVDIATTLNQMGYPCIVAVHVTSIPPETSIAEILDTLRPGDFYTHPYQNAGDQLIFAKDRTILPCIWEAKKRGVLFSSASGGIHWSINNIRDAYAQGFYPDIISSDLARPRVFDNPGFSLLFAMCTSLVLGMDEIEVLKRVTINPATYLGLQQEIGTLQAGTTADIVILDVVSSKQKIIDRFRGEVWSEKVFEPLMTIRNGVTVYRSIRFM